MDITSSNIAFMIRNDGKAFPVIQHYYGNTNVDDVEETIFAGEWLFEHTNHSKTKELYITLLKTWINHVYEDKATYFDKERMLYAFESEIKSRGYVFLSFDFVKKHIDEIMESDALYDLEGVNKLVCEELNQEFLRARYGGMYNSSRSTSGEMVFRISSTNFNWFDVIWLFVNKNISKISTVTIVTDEESTGKAEYYKEKGIVFDNCPVDDFVNLSGNPVFESFENKDKLAQGNSILDSFLPANYNRIAENYYRMRFNNVNKFSFNFNLKEDKQDQ